MFWPRIHVHVHVYYVVCLFVCLFVTVSGASSSSLPAEVIEPKPSLKKRKARPPTNNEWEISRLHVTPAHVDLELDPTTPEAQMANLRKRLKLDGYVYIYSVLHQ